jgi:hypothetical protein
MLFRDMPVPSLINLNSRETVLLMTAYYMLK